MRIVEYPHPALRYPAVPVKLVDKELRLQVGRMFELMYEVKGLGLAAPQVALPYQLLIMNEDMENFSEEGERVYLNPRIVAQKGTMNGEEGCLSFPGLFAKVRRARQVTIEAYDLSGELVTIQATGLASRCWQHEIEHLQGKLFIDRFTTVARIANQRELSYFEKKFRRAQEMGEIAPDADIEKLLSNLEQEMART